jgi:uncharacterized protein YfaS (alpha-2-macroglobulin family)/TolA-binding protein
MSLFALSRHGKFAVLALAVAAATHFALAQEAADPKTPKEAPVLAPEPEAPVAVRQAMQDRNFDAAVKAIDAAMAGEGANKDYLAYLKGRALHLAEKYDEAIARFDTIEKEFPKSEWIRRARFGMAVSLARKGDFRAAELIYRREAEYLLSADRKQEIANLYLDFAQTYFKPPKEEQKPDYQKALGFFQNALAVGPKPEKKREVEMLVAECYFNLGNFAEAARLYDKFVKDYPDAPELVEAKFRLGESQLKQGQLAEARRTWQDLLAAHADNKSPRIAEATFNLSLTYSMPNPPSDEDLGLGVAALDAFVKKYPDHKLASTAHLRIAQAYVNRGRPEEAAKRLTTYLADARYAEREETPEARSLLGQSYLLQKKFAEAITAWRDYLTKHPTHSAWSSVQQAIVDAQYTRAADRREAKDYAEARKLWTEFLANYPLDPRGPTIWYTFGAMNFEQEKWEEAIADWTRLVSKYPGSGEASRAQLMIGHVLEAKQGKLAAALEQYKKVQGGSQPEAAQRIVQLTAKTMAVVTERVFRSNETPKLKFTSRNIDAVTVRIYSIDLETYFRKMHLAGGVEGLDISLIDPDHSFEFKVPKYAEYQELESQIEVPLPQRVAAAKSGAMAITVSSKTLTATTLVLQSDLDIIVKSSRNEVFVLAENMVTGQPWKDVKLLISNGQTVFAEAKTGDDGVFKGDFKELASAGDVRVFAVAGSHTGSNIVGLDGVGVATGLADKGYIYTDRPAYRPGDMVHVRGVIRGVSGDAFTIAEGAKYTIQVFDPRNRMLHQEEAALSGFGALRTHFLLPSAAVQGEYRVLVTEAAKEIATPKSYQGTFGVHEYRLEPVRVAIEADRMVYYRGEEIKGKIKAQFYYGAPMVGTEVRYQLAGGAVTTAKTNDKGEIEFTFPTREYRETQTLPLVVTLVERNLSTMKPFVLATKGFSIGISTVRPVYLAGESFEASIKTNDAEGKPIAQKLNLKVLERTTIDGRVGERLVSEHSIETDKEGNARQTLKLDAGGQYIIRAEGTDRFENPIYGTAQVQLSDDKDAVRLRMLADKHTFKVGDVAKVNLHWREEPALALVTFQGARVLDYKLVTLKKGDNPLELPMTAALAPNFELAVAVMTDTRPQIDVDGKVKDADKPITRLHLASSPFTVTRELKVTVEVKRKNGAAGDAKPGEEVDVVITTTDAQGKPVETEISLAMIEQSLLEQFSFAMPAIQDFFGGGRRETAVRTTASITFAYRPATQAINPRLLAEEDRKMLESLESERLLAGQTVITEGTTRIIDGRETNGNPREWQVAEQRSGLGAVAWSDIASADDALDAAPNAPADAPTEEFAAGGELYANSHGGQPGGGGFAGRSKSELAKRMADPYSRRSGVAGKPGNGISAGLQGAAAVAGAYAPVDIDGDGIADVSGDVEKDGGKLKAQLGDALAYGLPMDTTSGVAAFGRMLGEGRRDVVTVDKSGKMANVYFGLMTDVEQNAEGKRLADAGAMLLPQLIIQETGYWNPSIVTGKDGKATVAVTLPDRSTAWKLLAKGATKETLCGEADASLAAKKELFGELKLPLAFTDGDEAEIAATVHNHAVDKGTIKVTLKTTVGGKSDVITKSIDVAKQGIEQLTFKQSISRAAAEAAEVVRPENIPGPSADELLVELTVEADGKSDVVRRRLPIKPYGLPVYNIAGGSASADTTAWVEAPANVSDDARSLQILLGPTVERSLLDVLFGPATICQIDNARLASSLDTATSDALAAIALVKLLSDDAKASATVQALDVRLRSTVSLLVAAQNDDGGWSWTGQKGTASHRYTSARVVWALALARKTGYRVPDDGFNAGCNFLASEIAKTRDDDYESKAILLHALSVAGRDDFALANRLHRNRPALSTSALLHVALSLAEMDRKPMAEELLKIVAERNLDTPHVKREALAEPVAHKSLPWTHASAETRALYALALIRTSPESSKLKEQVDWLLANRAGHRWAPDKATGPAMVALCEWNAKNRVKAAQYELDIFVNDVKAKTVTIDDTTATQTIDVAANLLGKGKQRINFVIRGRGTYTYQAVLGGFVPADKLASTTQDWHVRRYYEPAPRELDGKEVPRGFGVIEGPYTPFRNSLTQLPIGQRGHVELTVSRINVPGNVPEEQLEYLVVTEPLPSGASVVENSVHGGFERYEISPGAITFYVGSRRYVEPIHYDIYGYLAGNYQAAPTVVRNAYRADQLAAAGVNKLAVLAAGTASGDAYRLSPQELYELGKRHFDKNDFETAGKHLADLIANWNLRPEFYKETARMLLDVHLARGPASGVVKYFEIVKEKWPDLEMPFEKIVKVGAAYHDMGEYERAYLIFRATVESSFSRESGVAGFLDGQGEFLRSIDVMRRLLLEYPAESYAAVATYALAQQVYGKAASVAADEKLREKKITRVDLIRQAHTMLEGFLTMYPEDPAADQASFSAANALLDLKAYKAAIAACEAYAKRYPKSDYLDSYWYLIGYCHFAQHEHEAALAMCQKVADAKRVDKNTGREVESVNKDRAIYIMGQVYHSLGKAAEAIVEYTRVKERFADAAQAIEYFARKEIKLPEITTIRPGKPAEVKLSFRNVANCEVMVYRIDLMKFSLLRRNLGEITAINLAGIRPHHEEKVKLGDGKDYRDREHTLTLPLKEEGAYLVVCRGENLHTSGLAVVSPLEVEVQEDRQSGRVRTTVKDVTKDSYVGDAHVKVIGSRNADFISGQTDLRGVFVADGIQGTSTVIAQVDERRYAFYRGKVELGPPAPVPNAPAAPPGESAAPGKKDAEGELLDGLRQGNEMIIKEQQQNLKQFYEQAPSGVEVQKAY